jgi:hypothetical protein
MLVYFLFCSHHQFNLVWSQFEYQVVPTLFQLKLREIELWSFISSSASISIEPINDWFVLMCFKTHNLSHSLNDVAAHHWILHYQSTIIKLLFYIKNYKLLQLWRTTTKNVFLLVMNIYYYIKIHIILKWWDENQSVNYIVLTITLY